MNPGKINCNVTIEMIEDLKNAYGLDVEKHFEMVLRLEKIKLRKDKIKKIISNHG